MIQCDDHIFKMGWFNHQLKSDSVDFSVPETNSEFAPENGWLLDDRFLLGPGLTWKVRTSCWFQGG